MSDDRDQLETLIARNWLAMVRNAGKMRDNAGVAVRDQQDAAMADLCSLLGVDINDEVERHALVAGSFLYAFLSPSTAAAEDTIVVSSIIAALLGKGGV